MMENPSMHLVLKDTEGFGNLIPGSEVASMNEPLKPGESGVSEFIPTEPGTYYYIYYGSRSQNAREWLAKIVVTGAGADSCNTTNWCVTRLYFLTLLKVMILEL